MELFAVTPVRAKNILCALFVILWAFFLPVNLMQEYLITLSSDKHTLHSMVDIKLQLDKVPLNRPVSLCFTPCNSLTIEFIDELMRNLPPNVHGVNIVSLINFARIPFVHRLFSSLPLQIKYVCADNLWDHMTIEDAEGNEEKFAEDLINLFKALPKHVTKFRFKKNSLGMHPDLLSIILSGLSHIHSLDLRDNELLNIPEESWPNIWSHLSESVSELLLNFKCNNPDLIFSIDAKQKKILSTLPLQVKTLGLEVSDFINLVQEEANVVFSCLSNNVKTLRWFPSKIGGGLEPIIKATPPSITTLDLSDFSLGVFGFEKILGLVGQIPWTVISLNLDYNALNILSTQQLGELMAEIPHTLTQISLRGNLLFKNKNLVQHEQLLETLKPYNTDGRLLLENNAENQMLLAAIPLVQLVKDRRLPVELADEISQYLKPKKPHFFYEIYTKLTCGNTQNNNSPTREEGSLATLSHFQ
ncbi:MAG: hypothetical protein Q8M40_01155 [Legionella sp.]|nr:hypothetical protein [Legionella sp.]